MNLYVAHEAAEWYKAEFDLNGQSYVRFYVRYGFGGKVPGFSLAVSRDVPDDIYASTKVKGVTFFIERSDAWYFDDEDLTIQLGNDKQEPEFIYS
ncbi:HesB/YadR/YfhF family protein [Lentibacillus salinarum]|uniref:HesB/YadR/YfhF family protein n=1 Tax=Lentibacillus salinarum TaxID=446820 RepID=A0ABW3ZQE9_9BACI